MSTKFPRRRTSPRSVQIITVTFLPPTVAFAMLGEEGRVYVWARSLSPLIQDRVFLADAVRQVRSQQVGQVLTVTETNFEPLPKEEASRYAPALIRYIKRGTMPEEEPMLIVAYGIFGTPELRDALAETLLPAA